MQSGGCWKEGWREKKTEEGEEEEEEKEKEEEEEEGGGGWSDGLEAGAGEKKTKQSGQIRFGVEGSEQSDYSN